MQRLRKLSLAISIAGLTFSILVAVSTVLPGAPLLAVWPVLALVPLCILVHVRSVAIQVRARHRLGDLLARVPPRAMFACGAWSLFAGVLALVSIAESRGEPTDIDGVYYINDHGKYTLVSHAEYLHAQVLEQRIFSLIPSVFFALGVLANLRGPDATPSTATAAPWRATRWWPIVSSVAVVYGTIATLVWGWHAGLVWIVVGTGMLLALHRSHAH